MKHVIVFFAILMSTLSLAESPASSTAPSTTVTIDNFTFSPMTIEVQRGATIKWINKDDIPHVVASTAGTFKSRAIDTDGSFVFTFTEPGTYEYYCSVHPKMTGKIVVK
jgi:plastocyanin